MFIFFSQHEMPLSPLFSRETRWAQQFAEPIQFASLIQLAEPMQHADANTVL